MEDKKKLIGFTTGDLTVIQMLINKGIDVMKKDNHIRTMPTSEQERVIDYWDDLSVKFNLN